MGGARGTRRGRSGVRGRRRRRRGLRGRGRRRRRRRRRGRCRRGLGWGRERGKARGRGRGGEEKAPWRERPSSTVTTRPSTPILTVACWIHTGRWSRERGRGATPTWDEGRGRAREREGRRRERAGDEAHVPEAQAAEDGGQRADVGHGGDEDEGVLEEDERVRAGGARGLDVGGGVHSRHCPTLWVTGELLPGRESRGETGSR